MDLTHYRMHGYQVVRGLLDTDVIDAMRSFLTHRVDKALAFLMEQTGCRNHEELVSAIDQYSRRPDLNQLPADFRRTMSGHFPLETRLSPELWAIPRQPALRQLLEEVLNHQTLFMHMPPTARFILPNYSHSCVPAHQDATYNIHMSDFVTAWVPLVTIDDRCGGVAVYEGAGLAPVQPPGADDKFWVKPVNTEGLRKIHNFMQPGDILLLHPRNIHESMPNHSNHVRLSIDYRFFNADHPSKKHTLDLQTWSVLPPP